MSSLPRIFIVYAIAIPMALLLGYAMSEFGAADPDMLSVALIGLVLFVLVLPLLLHAYVPILLVCWNATFLAFFLPGLPSLFLVMSFAGLTLLATQRAAQKATDSRKHTSGASSVSWPMAFLGLVILVTALARGGIGIRALGSSTMNGKKYVELLAAISGYFVLNNQEIPRKRALFYACLFFLGGLTPAIGDLIYLAGPKFYWMYRLLSSQQAETLAASQEAASLGIFRVEGTAQAAVMLSALILARYGLKGLLDLRRPWRFFLVLIAFAACSFGGFRGRIFVVGLFFLIHFILEGLWRTWLMPVVLAGMMAGGGLIFTASDRLPEAVQRSISFLPVQVAPDVRVNAESTVEWRKAMWHEVEQQIPTYFWLGKGYGFTANDFYIATEMAENYLAPSYAPFIITGEYHNGPLSVIIPFGIFGMLGFLWFLAAGWRALWRNYRYGDSDLRLVNTSLLAFYTARAIMFFSVFGAIETELLLFSGAVGLSVAINRGIRKSGEAPRPRPEAAAAPLPRERALMPADV